MRDLLSVGISFSWQNDQRWKKINELVESRQRAKTQIKTRLKKKTYLFARIVLNTHYKSGEREEKRRC